MSGKICQLHFSHLYIQNLASFIRVTLCGSQFMARLLSIIFPFLHPANLDPGRLHQHICSRHNDHESTKCDQRPDAEVHE